jgi:peroxiredoxin
MQQIVDLQNNSRFNQFDVSLLSISFDPAEELLPEIAALGIQVPMLIDSNHDVSQAYGVLQWAVATGEPGHTFVLIDAQGRIAWIRDYGAPQNGGTMYVPVEELTAEIESRLQS